MVKYFYTCPIKAAFMMQYHGMNIGYAGVTVTWDDLRRSVDYLKERAGINHDKGWIFPYNREIFIPRIGDMISHLGVRAWRIDGMDEKTYIHPAIGNEQTHRFTFKSDNPTIIQRNGLAFHWPEVAE